MKFLISQLQKLKNKIEQLSSNEFNFEDFKSIIKEPILYNITDHKLSMIFDLLKNENNIINKEQFKEICEMCFEQLLEELESDKMNFDKALLIIENFKCLVNENNLQNSQIVKKSFLYQFFLLGEFQHKIYSLVLLHQSFPNSFKFGDIQKKIQIWEEDVLYNEKFFNVKQIDLNEHQKNKKKNSYISDQVGIQFKQDLIANIKNILDNKNINLNLSDEQKLQQDILKIDLDKECSPQCLQNKMEIQQDLNYYKDLLYSQDNKIQNYEKKCSEKDQILSQYSLEIVELKKKFKNSIQKQFQSSQNFQHSLIQSQFNQNQQLFSEEDYLDIQNQLKLQRNKNKDLLEQIQDLKQVISDTTVENVQLNSEKQQFMSQIVIQPNRQRTQSIVTLQNVLLKTQTTLDHVTEKYNQKEKENISLKKRLQENEEMIINMQQKLVDQLMIQSEQDPNQIKLQMKLKYQQETDELKNKVKMQQQIIQVLEKKLERIKIQNQEIKQTQTKLQIPDGDNNIHEPEINLKKNTFLQKLEKNLEMTNVENAQKDLEENLNRQLGCKKKKKLRQKLTKILGLPNEQKLDTKKYSYDYLDINNNKKILLLIRNFQQFKKNTKCFSSMIQRVNSWNKKTKKWLVITNKYIYIFTPPNKIKNVINIKEIQAIKHSKVNNYIGIQHIKMADEIFEIFKKTEFLLYLRKKILRKKKEYNLKEEKGFVKYSRINSKNQFIPEDYDNLKPNYNKTFLDASNNEDIYNVNIPIKNFLGLEYETEALMLLMNYGINFFDPDSYQQLEFYPMMGIFISRSVFSDKQISLLFCNNDQKFINFLSKREREQCYKKFILKYVEKKQDKK